MGSDEFKFIDATVNVSSERITFSIGGIQKINYLTNKDLPESISFEELNQRRIQSDVSPHSHRGGVFQLS